MKKFEVVAMEIPRKPSSARPAGDEGLRALVRFATSRGYHDLWNKPPEEDVRACSSTDFPTDRAGDSR
jgi:hypothetical protein